MSETAGGLISIAVLLLLLAAAYVPLGDHMARVYSRTTHGRVERGGAQGRQRAGHHQHRAGDAGR